jgi:hypothetical protein
VGGPVSRCVMGRTAVRASCSVENTIKNIIPTVPRVPQFNILGVETKCMTVHETRLNRTVI